MNQQDSNDKTGSIRNAVKATEMEMETENVEKPKWGVLTDDFMLGANFKTWNEVEDEEEDEESDD